MNKIHLWNDTLISQCGRKIGKESVSALMPDTLLSCPKKECCQKCWAIARKSIHRTKEDVRIKP